MQEEFLIGEAVELRQSAFCEGPEGFDTVHMVSAACKFVFAVEDAVVVISIEDEGIIGLPSIRKHG